MHQPTLKKLAKISSIRVDLDADSGSGNLTGLPDSGILLSNGHYMVHIPSHLWPASLARHTGRDHDRTRKVAIVEPADPSSMPDFSAVLKRSLGSAPLSFVEPMARPTLPGYDPTPIASIEGKDGPLVPLEWPHPGELGTLSAIDKAYYDLILGLWPDAVFYPTETDSANWPVSALAIYSADTLVGIIMPCKLS